MLKICSKNVPLIRETLNQKILDFEKKKRIT